MFFIRLVADSTDKNDPHSSGNAHPAGNSPANHRPSNRSLKAENGRFHFRKHAWQENGRQEFDQSVSTAWVGNVGSATFPAERVNSSPWFFTWHAACVDRFQFLSVECPITIAIGLTDQFQQFIWLQLAILVRIVLQQGLCQAGLHGFSLPARDPLCR